MKPGKNQSSQTKWGSLIIFFIVGLIAGVLTTSYIINRNHGAVVSNTNDITRLTNQSDSLETGFVKLLELNKKYASVLSDKNLDSLQLLTLDSLNILITQNETDFLKGLDSLQITSSYSNVHSSDLLSRIVAAYRLSLDQSNALSTVRNAFNIGNTNYNFDQTTLYAMQNELQQKESELIGLRKGQGNLRTDTAKNISVIKNTSIQQDSVLNVTVQLQKNRYRNLADYANKLKRDNDRLNNELLLMHNQNNQSNTTASSPASKDYIDEQIDFVKADCYMARADANQIVSNARQRKDLLQNALEILNKLSKSPAVSTREQAQQKLAELKIIAANNHD